MHSKPLFMAHIGVIYPTFLDVLYDYTVTGSGYTISSSKSDVPYVANENLGKLLPTLTGSYVFSHDLAEVIHVAGEAKQRLVQAMTAETARQQANIQKLSLDWKAFQEKALSYENQASPNSLPQVPTTSSEAPIPKTYDLYYAGRVADKVKDKFPCGYCAVLIDGDTQKKQEAEGAGHVPTRGRIQPVALLKGLGLTIEQEPGRKTILRLFTTDTYVASIFEKNLLPYWARNGWKKKDGGTLQNADLYEKIHKQLVGIAVQVEPVLEHDVYHTDCLNRAGELALAQFNKLSQRKAG